MKVTAKTTGKPKGGTKVNEKKLSKAGKAMRAGIGKGLFVEIGDDPWNLQKPIF